MNHSWMSKLRGWLPAFAATALFASNGSIAASPMNLTFMPHAAFFSAETKQPNVVDPQAFVQDSTATEAVGLQGIKHAAGFRPALVDKDARTSTIYTAEGKSLGFDLARWLGAMGSVTITEADGKPQLEAHFSGLKPKGEYSLFENHFDETPVGFTPMDGTAKANNFTAEADGTAKISMTLTHTPTHANAVLLVYHCDGQSHGLSRGRIGIDAHHQLIARPD